MSEKLSLPVSIIIAGLLIGGGIYLNGKITKGTSTQNQKQEIKSQNLANTLRPIDSSDRILGSSKARVLVIEYSDTECPFCKNFHSTMLSIMQEYGKEEKVAWVYRYFPIVELHQKSFKEATAAECAGKIGGNSKFWEYINKIYEITPSNDGLDAKELPNIAKQIGLSKTAFENCLANGETSAKVEADIKNAKELLGNDIFTPYSVIIDTKNKEYYPVKGAYPYANIKSIVDLILST